MVDHTALLKPMYWNTIAITTNIFILIPLSILSRNWWSMYNQKIMLSTHVSENVQCWWWVPDLTIHQLSVSMREADRPGTEEPGFTLYTPVNTTLSLSCWGSSNSSTTVIQHHHDTGEILKKKYIIQPQ